MKTKEVIEVDSNELISSYDNEIMPDPDNKLHLSSEEKKFIRLYCEYKNISVVCKVMGIKPDDAAIYLSSFSVSSEIKRINAVMNGRMFATKCLSLDNISSYLSSLVTDENVPIGDRLSSMEKVAVIRVLVDVIKSKSELIHSSSDIIDYTSIEKNISQLSVDEIKQLLKKIKDDKSPKEIDYQKNELINKLENENVKTLNENTFKEKNCKFSLEERAVLKNMSVKDIKQLIDNSKSKNIVKIKELKL